MFCVLYVIVKSPSRPYTGITFMRGSYVVEPRFLTWLRERTVLVKNSTTSSEYVQNTDMHLKLIFAFAAQSSLSKVCNNNVRNAVCMCGACARAVHYLCRIHKPVLGTRYSGTIPCRKICTNHDITVYK